MLLQMNKLIVHYKIVGEEGLIYEGIGRMCDATNPEKWPSYVRNNGARFGSTWLEICGMYHTHSEARNKSGLVCRWGGTIFCEQTGARYKTVRAVAKAFDISERRASDAINNGGRIKGQYTFRRELF